MILKLIGRVPETYYALQEAWGDKTNGSFGDFNHRTIAGVTFSRRFGMRRGPKFPLKKLFATIDDELSHGRYVLASLSSGGEDYHIWVIVQRLGDGRYRALSKDGQKTMELTDTREQIQAMQGTDIATYTISGSLP